MNESSIKESRAQHGVNVIARNRTEIARQTLTVEGKPHAGTGDSLHVLMYVEIQSSVVCHHHLLNAYIQTLLSHPETPDGGVT